MRIRKPSDERLVEKYRPKTFDDVVGQAAVIARLRNLVARGLGGRALLFIGPSGVGKTTVALIVARLWGCMTDEETYESVMDGSNLDIRFYKANALDQRAADELHTSLRYRPAFHDHKIAIIDEAQSMTEGARGSLLNIIEAAIPRYAVVIMTTTGFPTLKTQQDMFSPNTAFGSRPKRFNFEEPAPADIAERLGVIYYLETGEMLDPDICRQIVKEGEGNIRACVELLEDALPVRAEKCA